MSTAQFVQDVFSFYILGLGIIMFVAPFPLLKALNYALSPVPFIEPFPEEGTDGNVEFIGCLVFTIGTIYIGHLGNETFRRNAVWTRFAFAGCTALNVALGRIQNSYVIFVLQDALVSLLVLAVQFHEDRSSKTDKVA